MWKIAVLAVVAVLIGIVCTASSEIQDSNRLDSIADPTFELYIKVHEVGLKNYHTCMIIFTKYDTDDCFGATDSKKATMHTKETLWKTHRSKAGYKYFTIGAGGSILFWGTLKSDYNRSNNKNLNKLSYEKKIDDLSADEVQQIVNYHEYYKKQNHPKYTLFPKNDRKAYNSNSFAHGLFAAAGYDLSNPGHNLRVPGWKQKLPLKYFKK